jgi:hypothetical protein
MAHQEPLLERGSHLPVRVLRRELGQRRELGRPLAPQQWPARACQGRSFAVRLANRSAKEPRLADREDLHPWPCQGVN